jgi:G3E family GTPase
MDNGCVCCTVRGDLVRTLNELIPRRKDFHAIMLETTG